MRPSRRPPTWCSGGGSSLVPRERTLTWRTATDIRAALRNAWTDRAAGVINVVLAATAVHARATKLHYGSDFDHIAAAYPKLHTAWVIPRGAIN